MPQIDLDVLPRLEAKRAGALLRTAAEQGLDREHVAPARLAPRDSLELAQLLEGVDAHVRVRADADANPARAHLLDGEEAVAEVRLGRRARAHARACAGEEIELVAVRVRRVDDGRSLRQTPRAIEQLDRADAVLGQAFLDLARLLVRVDVQRQALA